ncbi:MAG TPA: FG-GAP-like repeat-containing protein [Pyrinomonadaceae bacterium]
MLPYSKTLSAKVFTAIFIFGLLFLLNPNATRAAAGDVDTSFVATLAGAFGGSGTSINSLAVQPDGKIIIAGQFFAVGKYPRICVARLNADGTVDQTFIALALDINRDGNLYINQAVVQPDGKILIGGEFLFRGQEKGLFRLNADGSPDSAFSNNIAATDAIFKAHEFVLSPDGKIFFAGVKRLAPNSTRASLWRISSEGNVEVEKSLVSYGKLALAPGGKLIALGGNQNEVRRLNTDLSDDPSFQQTSGGSSFLDVAVQPDGKVVVVGSFNTIFGFQIAKVARFNADGTLDSSFGAVNPGRPNEDVRVVKILPNGKILIGGEFDMVNNVATKMVAILNADGSLDTSFVSQLPLQSGSNRGINEVTVQADGKILADRFRLNADGSVDSTYAPQIRDRGFGYETAVQPDGKILVGGQFSFAGDKAINGLARFNADGSVDDTFNQTAFSSFATIRAIAVQPDGKILAGGTSPNFVRFTPTGAVDFTIPLAAQDLYDVKLQPDGKILVAGDAGGGYLRRFNANGTGDGTFTPTNNAGAIFKIALQPDGKIVAVGNNTFKVRRFNPDGTPDPTFNVPFGGPNNLTYDVAVQADGKILIGGIFTGVSADTNKKWLARLNADGSLDTAFQPVFDMFVRAIRIQPDGKILAAGASSVSNGSSVLPGRIVRVNQNGTLDPTFNNAMTFNDMVQSIDLQADNKIVVAGLFTRAGDVPNIGLARLLNPAAPESTPFDFDGDGKADISVFRPSTSSWYIARPTGIPSQNFDVVQFGANGDLIVPADYDGDGRTDVAVFRPADGTWYLLQSTAGFRAAQFGVNGDIPVPGDFDGDGKANLAVFRPSTGSWYIARATGVPSQNFDSVPFGANGDKPIVGADFDGDGKADVAVFRPADGNWYRLNSSNGSFVGIHFGIAEDKPVAADYDGDGKTDLAVWRPSDGVWYRINSGTDSFAATQFGIAEDRPSPADYDGDGKADLAVFRPSQGTWYLLRSTSGFTGVQFGANGDLPAPNAFVH